MVLLHFGHLTFSCIWCRDFQKIDNNLLAPMIEALGPVANISVESQVKVHLPSSFRSYSILYSVFSSDWDLIVLIYRFCTTHQRPHSLIGIKSWRAMSLVQKIFPSLYVSLSS